MTEQPFYSTDVININDYLQKILLAERWEQPSLAGRNPVHRGLDADLHPGTPSISGRAALSDLYW